MCSFIFVACKTTSNTEVIKKQYTQDFPMYSDHPKTKLLRFCNDLIVNGPIFLQHYKEEKWGENIKTNRIVINTL